MPQPNADAPALPAGNHPNNSEAQVALSQYVTSQAQRDAQTAAPSGLGERLWDVTKEGVTKIPEGFMHSLDPHNILPNIGAGFVIGAATKALLPEAGPIGKVAALLMTGWFVGKPLGTAYWDAGHAKTMADMHAASSELGDTLGGMPVSMAEGALGARLGVGVMNRALATDVARPYTDWKAQTYARLNYHVDTQIAAARNMVYDRLGVGSPVFTASTSGIIPPYMLEELAKRNPNNPDFNKTIVKINELARQGQMQLRTRTVKGGTASREVYDAQGEETQPGVKVRFEGDPPSGNHDADLAYEFTGDMRDHLKAVHGRNSIDNQGMNLISTVNYGQNFENAFWNGYQMTYGNPSAESPFKTFMLREVTGHEIEHGVSQYEANTRYYGQPGWLNESDSDIRGEVLNQWKRGITADQGNWLIGDGIWKDNIKGRALRDMLHPGTAYDDPAVGKDPQPDNMKDAIKTTRDNGGVHLNSGIPNRAFAEFALSVGGHSWEGPIQVWYRARELGGSSPSIAQRAYWTIEAAKELGHPEYVPKLEAAWAKVGVKPSRTAGEMPILPLIMNQQNQDKPGA